MICLLLYYNTFVCRLFVLLTLINLLVSPLIEYMLLRYSVEFSILKIESSFYRSFIETFKRIPLNYDLRGKIICDGFLQYITITNYRGRFTVASHHMGIKFLALATYFWHIIHHPLSNFEFFSRSFN